jgi:hypothetical protein
MLMSTLAAGSLAGCGARDAERSPTDRASPSSSADAGTATTVADLHDRIGDSALRVVHGSDDWNDHRQDRTPKDVFDAVAGLCRERPRIEFSFPEAALVLALARENQNRHERVYLFTFDGTLATLADTFDVPVLPYSTPLRDDAGR